MVVADGGGKMMLRGKREGRERKEREKKRKEKKNEIFIVISRLYNMSGFYEFFSKLNLMSYNQLKLNKV